MRLSSEERDRRAGARRLDHHPAGRQVSAAGQQLQSGPQDPGNDPRLPAGIDADQGADPRALPQLHLPWPERLWSAGRQPRLFRQGRHRPALPEAAYLAILPKAPSTYDPVRETGRALDRRNYVLREMENNGYIDAASSGRRPPDRLAPTATAATRNSARRAAISWKRSAGPDQGLKFGEKAEHGPNSVYAGGLWVRTSMVPVCRMPPPRRCARASPSSTAAAAGAISESRFDVDGDWAGSARPRAGRNRFPRLAQSRRPVEERRRRRRIGFSNGTTGVLRPPPPSMPKRGVGGRAFTHLRPGMIIIVKKVAGDSYALRSIPEVGGGFVAEEVRTGRCWPCRAGSTSSDRATTGRPRRFASPVPRSSRWSMRPRWRTA